MTAKTRTLRVLVACLLSGLIAGLLAAAQCRNSGSGCNIAPLEALSSDPVSWTLWLHWINWLPGIVFGLLFAAAALPALQSTPFDAQRVLAFAVASAIIYVLAGLVFAVFLDVAGLDEFSLIVWIWPAGFCAGLVGGFLLGVGANKLLAPASSPHSLVKAMLLPAAVGALAGVLFVWICSYGEQHIFIAFPLAFILWQVGVGLTLASFTSRQNARHASPPQADEERHDLAAGS